MPIPELEDVEKLKEFMYRSSEQLKYLTEQVINLSNKLDEIARDVVKVQTDIDNHPLLCPLNLPQIHTAIQQELSKIPEQRLSRNVKWAAIISSIISFGALIVGITMLIHNLGAH